jgi:hypothetical protein
MTAGPWSSRAEFEAWWRQNVIAFNRLAVTDPREWERIAKAIEEFNWRVGRVVKEER